MKIPTFTDQVVVEEDGHASDYLRQFVDVLTQQMQLSLSNDGFVMPSQTTTDIKNISNPSNPNARGNGTIWYDTTLNKYVGKENGTLVVFTTTPL